MPTCELDGTRCVQTSTWTEESVHANGYHCGGINGVATCYFVIRSTARAFNWIVPGELTIYTGGGSDSCTWITYGCALPKPGYVPPPFGTTDVYNLYVAITVEQGGPNVCFSYNTIAVATWIGDEQVDQASTGGCVSWPEPQLPGI